MSNSKFTECFFVIALLSIFCSWASVALDDNDEFVQTAQNGIHRFTANFIQILHQKNVKSESISFSPINIYAGLLLLHLGSNSTTCDEITNILEIPQSDSWPEIHQYFSQLFEPLTNLPDVKLNEEYFLNVIDSIFLDRIRFKKRFVALARSYYDSDIIRVNFLSKKFEANKIINKYIAYNVENNVQQFYTEPQTPYSKVILTNCLHFKSWWKFFFRKSATRSDLFHTDKGLIKVQMMQRVGYMTYANLTWLSSEVGCLPVNPNASVFIILPYKELGLSHLLDNLYSDHFNQIVYGVFETRRVDFKLPRIKLQWCKYLDETLLDLGAKEMFSTQANFHRMAKNKGLNVREIKYVADIRITEYEIEASSVTAVKIGSSSVVEPSPNEISELHIDDDDDDDNYANTSKNFAFKFNVNRPFLMFIYRHDIKMVMFVAAVNDPSDRQ